MKGKWCYCSEKPGGETQCKCCLFKKKQMQPIRRKMAGGETSRLVEVGNKQTNTPGDQEERDQNKGKVQKQQEVRDRRDTSGAVCGSGQVK